ncbi:MAG: molecular chaperone DnaJ [Clostridia bacterium]|nr:molecular chaperone DnaJ [Clostridia bacterium]
MAQRDYYEVLGLDKSADADAIKRAYRQLAKKYHPDLNPGDAEAEKNFKEVNEAYSILSDPDKKAKYDQYGHAAFDPTAGGGYSGGGFSGGFGDFGDLGDIFSSIFGGGFGGGTTQRRNGPQQGDDVGARVTLTFEEAAFGCKKDVSYNRLRKCPACNGTGAEAGTSPETCPDCRGRGERIVNQRMGGMTFQTKTACEKCRGTGKFIKSPCQKCRGSGLERENRKLTVNIPAGIDNGERIALRGQGCDGKNGGPAGDLVIEVTVRSHSVFERDGVHIYCEVPVTVTEATLGAEIEVPTLEGTVKYNLDEGTQPGTVFTLRGKGIPYVNDRGGRRGDLICTVVVEIPRGLSDKQKDALREFADACGEKNYTKKGKFNKAFKKKEK